MTTCLRHTAALLLLAFLPASALAQQDQAVVLGSIRTAYQQLDYAGAAAQARAALAEAEGFTVAQLTELHTLLALITFSQNDEAEARRQFETALSLTPTLTLDPLLVSPKIVDFFEAVRDERRQRQARDDTAAIRYVVVEDPRVPAALRSVVVPGWGQVYKGERRRGYLMAGAWASAASSTLILHRLRASAETAYLDETNPARVASRYDTFNSRHRLRNALAWTTAAVWFYSYLDALTRRPPGQQNLTLAPTTLGWQPGMMVTVRF